MDEVDGGGHDTDNDDCLATAVVQTEEIWVDHIDEEVEVQNHSLLEVVQMNCDLLVQVDGIDSGLDISDYLA